MSAEELQEKILLVEDSLSDAEVVERFLQVATRSDYIVTRAASLDEALTALSTRKFAVILLDLNLPDSLGLETFEQVYSTQKSKTPIVVMTGLGDEEEGAHMVRGGAYDFMVKGSFDAPILRKVIRYARERFALIQELVSVREQELLARERESREHELRILAEMTNSTSSSTQAPRPLFDTVPAYFANLVASYGELLEMALERRIYSDKSVNFTERLKKLAHELGHQRASPKDLVKLHSRALQKRTEQEGQTLKHQAYIEEGRLLLLELMGYIIEYYRAPSSS